MPYATLSSLSAVHSGQKGVVRRSGGAGGELTKEGVSMAEVTDRLYLGRILPGMDVCDVTGEKVGSISHIYRFDDATEDQTSARAGEELIEVKTGFLGLGKHLYIPMEAVQEVLTDSI